MCAFTKAGFNITFPYRSCTVSKNGKVLVTCKLNNNVYVIENMPAGAQMVSKKSPHAGCVHLLHRRLGHVGFNVIYKMLALLGDEKVKSCDNFLDCQVCKSVKSKAYSVAKESDQVSEQVHADVIGAYPKSHQVKDLHWFWWTTILGLHGFMHLLTSQRCVKQLNIGFIGFRNSLENSWLEFKQTEVVNLCPQSSRH